MDNKIDIGKRIAETRRRAGLTQEKLAEHASMDINVIKRIEGGRQEPKASHIIRIAEVLNVSYDYILMGMKPGQMVIRHDLGLSSGAIDRLCEFHQDNDIWLDFIDYMITSIDDRQDITQRIKRTLDLIEYTKREGCLCKFDQNGNQIIQLTDGMEININDVVESNIAIIRNGVHEHIERFIEKRLEENAAQENNS